MRAFALVLLLCVGVCVADVTLLVSKRTIQQEIVARRDVAVNVRIFNVGSDAAHDVSLEDAPWSSELFSDSTGTPSAKWDKIPAGGNVSHTFFVHADRVGVYEASAATVTFRERAFGPQRVAHSNELPARAIRRFSFKERSQSSYLFEWGVFAAIVVLQVLMPFRTWKSFCANYVSGLRKGGVLHTAQQALAAKKSSKGKKGKK